MTHDGGPAGARSEIFSHGAQRSRKIKVVAIQPAYNLACGQPQALVDGMDISAVRLADVVSEMLCVLSDDFNTPIITTTVDDDVFKLGVTLKQYRPDGPFKEFALVQRRGDYRDSGPRLISWEGLW